MRTRENDFGGKTLTLSRTDNLRAVPKAMQHLITADVATVFHDPHSYFADIARKTPIIAMREWLEAMLQGTCELMLSTTYEETRYDVAFKWSDARKTGDALAAGRDAEFILGNDGPIGGEICLPEPADLNAVPAVMRAYFALVGEVRWCGLGHSGSLYAANRHQPMQKPV